MNTPETIDALLRGQRLGIDLRSPSEFQRSAAPGTRNLPLLTDAERSRIGITYKQQGQEAALRLGHKLVAGATRERRIDGWATVAASHPKPLLYCWRGGLRSALVAEWLSARGVDIERLPGGYRAIRRRCLELIEDFSRQQPLWLLGGRTGTGKTRLLSRLPQTLDLEGIAQHRGSAFGELAAQQPTPASFENRLAAATLSLNRKETLVLEDESRTIGRLALPESWFLVMQRAPIVLLESALEERVAHIHREYIDDPLAAGQSEGELYRRYTSALSRIRKRLGGKRHQSLVALLEDGFESGQHQPWIQALLEQYYDPSYDFQLRKKQSRIVFRGEADAIVDYVKNAKS